VPKKLKFKITARWLRYGVNVWPPFLGAGIRLLELSEDYSHVRVKLKLRWYNRNYVKTQYGGSLFSMTDPWYMLMLLHRLGSDYIVWDMHAEIRYRAPGKGDVFAEFNLDETRLSQIREKADRLGKYNPVFEIKIVDGDGTIVAEISRTLYVRNKHSKPDIPAQQGAKSVQQKKP